MAGQHVLGFHPELRRSLFVTEDDFQEPLRWSLHTFREKLGSDLFDSIADEFRVATDPVFSEDEALDRYDPVGRPLRWRRTGLGPIGAIQVLRDAFKPNDVPFLEYVERLRQEDPAKFRGTYLVEFTCKMGYWEFGGQDQHLVNYIREQWELFDNHHTWVRKTFSPKSIPDPYIQLLWTMTMALWCSGTCKSLNRLFTWQPPVEQDDSEEEEEDDDDDDDGDDDEGDEAEEDEEEDDEQSEDGSDPQSEDEDNDEDDHNDEDEDMYSHSNEIDDSINAYGHGSNEDQPDADNDDDSSDGMIE